MLGRDDAPGTVTAPSTADSSSPDTCEQASRLAVVATIAVGIGLAFGNGHLNPIALPAMTVAALAAGMAAGLGRWPAGLQAPRRLAAALLSPEQLLGWAIATSLVINFVIAPGDYVDKTKLSLFRPLVLLAAGVAITYRTRQPKWLLRVRFPLLVVIAFVMAVLVIRSSPKPAIDVWYVLQYAARYLVNGQNPYAGAYPNIYGMSSPFYGAENVFENGTVVYGYPYLPLLLMMSVPGVILLHDVRWVLLACVVVAGWSIRRLGRGTFQAELAAVFFLFQPRIFFLLEQSWTEPFVLITVLLTLHAAQEWKARDAGTTPRGGWFRTGLAGAALVGIKQYSPIALVPLFFALPPQGRRKAAALAVLLAALIMLPFVLWNPSIFLGTTTSNQNQAFRADALAWPAAIAWLGGPRLPFGLSFLVAAGTLAATLTRRISLGHAMIAAAAAMLGLLLFHKLAFCNYYWLAGSLACAAVALFGAERRSAPPPPGSRDFVQRPATE